MKIIYSNTARQDLREIYEYVAYTLLVPETAINLSEKIMSSVRSLENMPERHALYKEEPWHTQGVRFLKVRNYLVFYVVKDEAVFVLRIMYGGRDISRQLEETIEY